MHKRDIIEWIYSLQVLPNSDDSNLHLCGFRGSSSNGASHDPYMASLDPVNYDSGHIAMTYTAILSLVILGDDLSRVNKRGIVTGLRQLQLSDGSFCSTPEGSENDMRFIYCASCISYFIQDWGGIDIELAIDYILKSLTYEGAFGQGPCLEAHDGSLKCEFRGSPMISMCDSDHESNNASSNGCYIAMTYSSLCSLLILEDDFQRINRKAVANGIQHSRTPEGCFVLFEGSSQSDLTFLYCAVCTAYIVQDFECLDVDRVCSYIKSCRTYEGGFGHLPGLEPHGSATYSVVASLVLLRRLRSTFTSKELESIKRWCLNKEQTGYSGRTNKLPNASYSYWIQATLKLLGVQQPSEDSTNRSFLISLQSEATSGFIPNEAGHLDVGFVLCHLWVVVEWRARYRMD